MSIGMAKERYEEILRLSGEIAKNMSAYVTIMETQLVFPFELPVVSMSKDIFYDFLKKLHDKLKDGENLFKEIIVINSGLERTKTELSDITVDTETVFAIGHWYTVQALMVKVYYYINDTDGKEHLERVLIPIACNDKGCRLKMNFKDILQLMVFLQENHEIVNWIEGILAEINNEYAETLEKLHTLFNSLRLIGFETADNS